MKSGLNTMVKAENLGRFEEAFPSVCVSWAGAGEPELDQGR